MTIERDQMLLSRLTIASCLLVAVGLVGCSSSSTTTREMEDRSTGILQDENEFIYLSKIRKEKTAEDDRKVGVESLRERRNNEDDSSLPASVNRDKFLLTVVGYLGVQYSYGGNTTKGLDCSGYVCRVFESAISMKLPRSTHEQFRHGERIKRGELRFGDLVFFNTTGRTPSHVGIYIEDDVFAHASVIEGVTLSSLESTYYKKRFVGARRVLED